MIRPVTAIAGVLVVLALLIAPYLRPWVAQRSEIAAAEQHLISLQQDVDRLTIERARWEDPAYVAAQARERLRYVKPGERAYVLDRHLETAETSDPRRAAAVVPEPDAARPWFATLWWSVRTAGDATTRVGSGR